MGFGSFFGNKAKIFRDTLRFKSGPDVISSTTDPTSSAVDADTGSLLLNRSNGNAYMKQDNGSSTNWELLASTGAVTSTEFSDAMNLVLLDTAANNWSASKQNNFNFESSVGDWVAYADAAGTAPVDMTGGSPNTTMTRDTTNEINGTASGLITVTTGATRQGEGVSCVVNIPAAYRGKDLVFRFPFVTTGTITEDDFKLYAFDVTNSEVITPFTFGKILGSSGMAACKFQTKTSTAQIRVGVHIARASNTGAVTIEFDDVVVTPASSPVGMAGSDWMSYTPTYTGFGTVSSDNAYWRRVGDSLQIRGKFTAGTPTATEARISFPTGLTASSAISSPEVAGLAGYNNQSTTYFLSNTLIEPSVSYITFGRQTSTGNVLTKQNGNGAVGTGELLSWSATIPISGWSANVTMAESSTFKISSYLASGTRVTTTPSKLGEYRTLIKGASSNTTSDTNGSGKVTVSDGMRIYSQNFATAGVSTEPNKWIIFVGKNKSVKVEGYQSAGRSGAIDFSLQGNNGNGNTTTFIGTSIGYDPTTGLMILNTADMSSNCTIRLVGFGVPDGTGSNSIPSDAYFDVIVSENALAVGVQSPRSMIRLSGGNGHGSSSTNIRRFVTIVSSIGNAITYTTTADTSILGSVFTINESGIYSITYIDRSSAGSEIIGVSLNSNQLSTSINGITNSHRLTFVHTPAANLRGSTSVPVILSAGDVIRAHTEGGANGTNDEHTSFIITKVSN